jgi:hypothetical protein
MELYAGLFLVTIGIGYLTVRYFQYRFPRRGVKDIKAGPSQASRQSYRSRNKPAETSAARSKSVTRSLGRPTLVAGSVQKPWGW